MSFRNQLDIYEGMARRLSFIKYNTESRWGLVRERHKLNKYVSDPVSLVNPLNDSWPMVDDKVFLHSRHLHRKTHVQDVFNALLLVYDEAGWDT